MLLIVRLLRLSVGLFFYALGIIFTINANIGYSPWDSFHVGLSDLLGASIGSMTILVGCVVGFYVYLSKETIGLGMLFNMLLVGLFMDLLLKFKVVPISEEFWRSFIMIIVGLIVMAFATYFYISAGFGAGPRDTLMILFTRRYGLSTGCARAIIESSVLLFGYFLGAKLGFGTLFYVVLIGPIFQLVFKLVRFTPKEMSHENIRETFYRFTR